MFSGLHVIHSSDKPWDRASGVNSLSARPAKSLPRYSGRTEGKMSAVQAHVLGVTDSKVDFSRSASSVRAEGQTTNR
jgi:hypothetical protein